ncbi:uroporphyrinogen-III C-methyltransferase [Mixta theicola]|uniref:uroporphyrinogen-III C-methyltransferase n=1 Tax=Mixta theicola TaxID=1458355 RepID=A0A2K1Q5D6_9GAMM|nr:uroporphyrinogen-III C-methyltransferase [Mixta theicola]PNS10255.1 uroporphyrinogen-III C-methyltransferase [Mixta theicola]GLR09520.1 uroporphyrinogen-III C-methyltransferase [Mixta theicola]
MTQRLPALNKLLSGSVSQPQGSVWLVGAGPGDAGLLTLKALRLLGEADVVVYDRLVSEEVLALIPASTLALDAGKTPGFHGMKQHQISQLLVDLARSGRNVVRLKGGDPFIFGRGGEEMQQLQAAGIACQIVPGITAATGCAAACGIPLTHREMAQSVRFITGHGKEGKPQLAWESLQDASQTLVFYMGLTWSAELSLQLCRHGRAADTPVAVVERGTRHDQRVLIATLATLAATIAQYQPQSPSLIIVGEVVTLYRPTTEDAAEGLSDAQQSG